KFAQGLSPLISATRSGVEIAEQRSRQWIVIELKRLFVFSGGFFVETLYFQYFTQLPAGIVKVRIHLHRFLQLDDRLIITSGVSQDRPDVCIDNDRQRIKLERALHLSDCFVEFSERDQPAFGVPRSEEHQSELQS